MHFVLSPFSLIHSSILEVELPPAVPLPVDLVPFIAAASVKLLHAILLKWMLLLCMLVLMHDDSAVRSRLLGRSRRRIDLLGIEGRKLLGRVCQAIVISSLKLVGLCSAELVAENCWRVFDDLRGCVDGLHFVEDRRLDANWTDFRLRGSAYRTLRCLNHSLRQTIVVGLREMNGAVHYCFAGDEVAGYGTVRDGGVGLPGCHWPVAMRTLVSLCRYVALLAQSIDFSQQLGQTYSVLRLRTQHSLQGDFQICPIPTTNQIEADLHALPIYPTAPVHVAIILPLQASCFQHYHPRSKNCVLLARALFVLLLDHSALFRREVDVLDVPVVQH